MKPDTALSLRPYFEVHEGKMDDMLELQHKIMDRVTNEENMLYYGFSQQRDGNEFLAREGYTDGNALLHHLDNVGDCLEKLLSLSTITRCECHGPAAELDKVRGALEGMGCTFWESDNKGERR